jgi:hypothetical protein
MTKVIFKTALSTVVLAFAGMALAACSLSVEPYGIFDNGPVASASATPKAEAEKPMSEFDKQVAAQRKPRPYTLSDGTTVMVDPTKPLPAPVLADIKAKITQPIQSSIRAHDSSAFDVLDAQAAGTGRGVVVVISSFQSGYTQWVAIASGQTQGLFQAKTSRVAAIAEATQWADARGFDVIAY